MILFSLGAALGMILLGASVYADFESTLFDISIAADGALRPINCPVFISSSETGQISATIRNSENRSNERMVRTNITRGHQILLREITDQINLAPRETKKLSWEVSAEGASFGHLILAKIVVLDQASRPSQKASCGIIVVDLPDFLKGWQVFSLLGGLSLSGLVSGTALWWISSRSKSNKRIEATRSILGLGLVIIAGLICVIFGFWEVGAGSFYIAMLLIGVIVPHFLISR